MSRNTLNLLLDLVSALILRFVLLPGSGPRTLWTLRRHDWGSVHFWLAVSLFAVLVLHVALHWQWDCSTVRRLVPGRKPEGACGSRLARSLMGLPS